MEQRGIFRQLGSFSTLDNCIEIALPLKCEMFTDLFSTRTAQYRNVVCIFWSVGQAGQQGVPHTTSSSAAFKDQWKSQNLKNDASCQYSNVTNDETQQHTTPIKHKKSNKIDNLQHICFQQQIEMFTCLIYDLPAQSEHLNIATVTTTVREKCNVVQEQPHSFSSEAIYW